LESWDYLDSFGCGKFAERVEISGAWGKERSNRQESRVARKRL
jgi:hypothetical protein